MAFVPSYILILMVTIAVDYLAGMLIGQTIGPRRRWYLIASLCVNVGALAIFKYTNFILDNVSGLAQFIGWNYPIEHLAIILPIGLSFHIFQSMAYTIEVYRGNQAPERHLGIFALYVMYYPQLVAGPIERPQNLLPQFRVVQRFEHRRVAEGLLRMGWGLFKKSVIADRLAIYVNAVFAEPTSHHGLPLALAVLFFGIQIYCDFSGYSDIALGASKVMGIQLMENFNRPYSSKSIQEFWTRWHIGLSSWFRDYVYLPLGGNRVSRARWCVNVTTVFLLSGLWHGASWTYVVWGGLHALYVIVAIWTADLRHALYERTGALRVPRLLAFVQIATTFGLVTFAWIFFRATTFADAWYVATHMHVGVLREWSAQVSALWTISPLPMSEILLGVAATGVMGAVHELINRHKSHELAERFRNATTWQRWLVYYALLTTLVFLGEYHQQSFIYFQF